MNRKLNVLVVFDTAGTPPENQDFTQDLKSEEWKTERHVINTLRKSEHTVDTLGVYDNLKLIIGKVGENRPDIIFNLVEHFHGHLTFDRNVAGLYELLGIPYTGSGPVGLMLAKNKGLSKKILNFHRVKTPAFIVFHRDRRVYFPKRLRFPIIIKPLREEASYGISARSVVENEADFLERVRFIHDSMERDAIAEEFVVGRELYVSVLGNYRLSVFPPREIIFRHVVEEEAKFATYKAKWDEKYRKEWGIENKFATGLSDSLLKRIEKAAKKVYRLLYMQGYARIDIRLTKDEEIVVLEANPNPFIANDEDFALSARKGGIDYAPLLQRIVNLGLERLVT